MVDNGSTDGTARPAAPTGATAGDGRRVVASRGSGLSRARNAALAASDATSCCSSTTTPWSRPPGPRAHLAAYDAGARRGRRRRARRAGVAGGPPGVDQRRAGPVVQRPRPGRRGRALPHRARALRHQHVGPPGGGAGRRRLRPPAGPAGRRLLSVRGARPHPPAAGRRAGPSGTTPRPPSSSRCCPSGWTSAGCCAAAGPRA